jgi:hypothetical protein
MTTTPAYRHARRGSCAPPISGPAVGNFGLLGALDDGPEMGAVIQDARGSC